MTGSKTGLRHYIYWMYQLHGPRAQLTRGALFAAARILVHYTIQLAVFDRLAKQLIRKTANRWTLKALVATWAAGQHMRRLGGDFGHSSTGRGQDLTGGPAGGGAQWYKGPIATLQDITAREGLYMGVYRDLGLSLVD